MAIITKEALKDYFKTGNKPIESNYTDLIDTLSNVTSGILIVNLDSRVAFSSTGDTLEFELDVSISSTFSPLIVSAATYNDQTNWEYFNQVSMMHPFPLGGLLPQYQNTTYGKVAYTWDSAERNTEYYIRYRSYADGMYSPYIAEKKSI